jgi:hypothetical protein
MFCHLRTATKNIPVTSEAVTVMPLDQRGELNVVFGVTLG